MHLEDCQRARRAKLEAQGAVGRERFEGPSRTTQEWVVRHFGRRAHQFGLSLTDKLFAMVTFQPAIFLESLAASSHIDRIRRAWSLLLGWLAVRLTALRVCAAYERSFHQGLFQVRAANPTPKRVRCPNFRTKVRSLDSSPRVTGARDVASTQSDPKPPTRRLGEIRLGRGMCGWRPQRVPVRAPGQERARTNTRTCARLPRKRDEDTQQCSCVRESGRPELAHTLRFRSEHLLAGSTFRPPCGGPAPSLMYIVCLGPPCWRLRGRLFDYGRDDIFFAEAQLGAREDNSSIVFESVVPPTLIATTDLIMTLTLGPKLSVQGICHQHAPLHVELLNENRVRHQSSLEVYSYNNSRARTNLELPPRAANNNKDKDHIFIQTQMSTHISPARIDPDDGGSVGQVIVFGHDFDTKVVLWTGDGPAGWAKWLACFVDDLESGEGYEIGGADNIEEGEDDLDPDARIHEVAETNIGGEVVPWSACSDPGRSDAEVERRGGAGSPGRTEETEAGRCRRVRIRSLRLVVV
ncbi:hypothetical protein B0H11DRAFT_1921944 [Mycena galericulata]|nr:hypothetical protein B0H11DRAFT_1921944 [Mycena galericulata]